MKKNAQNAARELHPAVSDKACAPSKPETPNAEENLNNRPFPPEQNSLYRVIFKNGNRHEAILNRKKAKSATAATSLPADFSDRQGS